MADAPKKEEKKEGGLAPSSDILSLLFGFLVVTALLAGLINRITAGEGFGSLAESDTIEALQEFYDGFKIFSFLISVILSCVIAYFVHEINLIRTEERKALYPVVEESKTEVMNKKWQRVIDHLESSNPSDWKLSIIEADILLSEMLEGMGYHGDTVGEKLKRIEKSDFTNIEKAWEAHKVRNQIAHEGGAYVLTKKEAVRVIELYKDVFEEFYFI